MPTECSVDLFGFAPVEGRRVEAAFDAGLATSDAGALLLGAADKAIKLIGRFAGCFDDARCQELIEHELATLVGQRVFAMALGYEDVEDHDTLRHDPVMAVLAGKLEAKRRGCAPVAGKSTLNRLELSTPVPTLYHKISYRAAAIEALSALKRPVRVELYTDSDYLRQGITDWIRRWKRNGWKTAEKKPVKNAELWQALDELIARHQVNWHWVRGHSGHPENERADELAVAEGLEVEARFRAERITHERREIDRAQAAAAVSW